MSKNSDLYEGQVTRPYKKWSDVKLSVETQRIKLSMFENPFFPNPEPNMTVFGDAIAAYVSQLAKAGTRDSSAIAAKNVRRAAYRTGHNIGIFRCRPGEGRCGSARVQWFATKEKTRTDHSYNSG